MGSKAYDVVIIGCGPGGATTGRFAALNGLKTLIVEKKRQIGFPIHDPASYLYSKSETEDFIGLKIDPRCIDSKAEGLIMFSPSGNHGREQPLPDGIFIDRYIFERFLAMEAVRAGAEIMLNTRAVDLIKEKGVVRGVVVKSGAGLTTVTCSVVIGADGNYGHVSRMANMPRPKLARVLLGCHFVGVRPLQPVNRSIEWHFWGVGRDPSTVCVRTENSVSLATSVSPDEIGGLRMSVREQFDKLVKHLERINRYNFDKASPVCFTAGSHFYGIRPLKDMVTDGVILIGDAASRPVPGCQWGAPGMLSAMFTGRLAAEGIAKAIKEGDVSQVKLKKEYTTIFDESLAGEQSQIIEATRLYYKLMTLDPDKLEQAVEEIGGEMASLHLYRQGALPLRGCLEPIKKWLGKE